MTELGQFVLEEKITFFLNRIIVFLQFHSLVFFRHAFLRFQCPAVSETAQIFVDRIRRRQEVCAGFVIHCSQESSRFTIIPTYTRRRVSRKGVQIFYKTGSYMPTLSHLFEKHTESEFSSSC